MEKIVQTFKNAFEIPDLRRKIIFTFFILALYRLGCIVLVPGVDSQAIAEYFKLADNGILSMVNMFSGGALGNAAVFALGIMPYITASIILQILQKSVPYLERLSKEGEQGRSKINRYTRYLTVVFGILHSYGITTLLLSMDQGSTKVITIDNTFFFRVIVMTTLTTGAIIIMWLGEKITEKGIGNGISLIIFASIVARIPQSVMGVYSKLTSGAISGPVMLVIIAVVLGTVIFVVFFELGVRKITINYAKRISAGGQQAGGTSFLPFKVNSAGVIPVIFSASIVQFPSMIESFMDPNGKAVQILSHFHYGRPLNMLIFFIATMFFTFFYVEMLFNPKDTAENLKKHGGFIPGIRPGKETQKYIEGVLKRLTFWGGLYLCMVSLVPNWIMSGLQLNTLPRWLGGDIFERIIPEMLNTGTGVMLAATLGGTSLLIVVSVALDFMNQIENQLVMHKYEGFTNKSSRDRAKTRRYA
ncbi:MAG: preprotein translocase subunit SecY [Acidobacteria bacterium]|nr:MAG: preprotein translocase subunit SecY [Acidobacteriota bacterium]PIE89999.1 MAG: preprotein translocase subunit SecY [Acidobacteriota bacterium]